MKIRETINWKEKPKFLRLKLIKNQTYKNTHHFKRLKIENIEYRLKKALHIIYKFHLNNKTILFVGSPINLYQQTVQLLKGTKHKLVPNSFWVNGIVTNQQASLQCLLKMKSSNKTQKTILSQLKEKNDLIVLLDGQNAKTILNESYVSKTPVISLNSNLKKINNESIYRVPGNFNFTTNKTNNLFFYIILKATLKKVKTNIQTKRSQTHRAIKHKQAKNKLKTKLTNTTFQKLVKSVLKKKNNVPF